MELDKNEWYDVYRIFRPQATREEFEREWQEFQQLKAQYLKKRSLQ